MRVPILGLKPLLRAPLVKAGALISASVLLLYLTCFHYSNPFERGIIYNVISGTVSVSNPGYHITPPWVFVSQIDIRPIKVCVASSARVSVCKLAQLNPDNLKDFADREGFRYYWWDNRVSFNMGHSEEFRGLADDLKGYAFQAEHTSFVTVVAETDSL